AVALNSAFDQLHGAMERQQHFTADASHELRTPLATLTAETEWALGRSRTADDYRGSLAICQRAAARMQQVVERLLASARGEHKGPAAPDAAVDLAALVNDAVDALRPLADKRQIGIRSTVAAATVTGDRDRLADAVGNVLANAVEYNRDGGTIVAE